MYRTFIIARHTFREAVVQPIYSLLLALGGVILIIFTLLPFFTLGEDTIMFKVVGNDLILLLVLIATLFATSKSIFDEIEDRTMLTLMSKPVRKWEVLLGKYLGIIVAAAMAVGILGVLLIGCVWWRIPGDYQLSTMSLEESILRQIADYRAMHVASLLPTLVLVWLQICVLAAIGVALSTRFSLVVNLPAVILLYIAGNLTRYLDASDAGRSFVVRAFSWVSATLLPFLQVFDFRSNTLYREIAVPGTEFVDAAQHPHAFSLGAIWVYVGVAALYGLAYATFALASGLLMFENRELGGAEG